MTRRRLATCALVLAVLPLSACGEGNPFGEFIQGPQQTGTTAPPTTVSPETTTATDTGTETGTGTPTDTLSGTGTDTGTATDTSTTTAPSGTGTPTSSPADTASPTTGPGATSTATTGATSAQTAVAQVDGRTIQGVPTGLGFPAEAGIEATHSFAGGGGSVVMSEPAEKEIFSYYRSALPGAGFRVVSDTAGTLAFTGHGFRGTLVGTGSGGVLTWSPAQG